jgi:hypothetical protein
VSDPIRVKTYRGETAEATARMFQADSAEAAKAGFLPTSQQWDGATLTVVFQRQDLTPDAPPPRSAPVAIGESHRSVAETPAPIVRAYDAASHEAALRMFQADAIGMAQRGYQPVSQQWVADDSGRGCFWIVIVIILLVTIIGILLLPFVMGGRKKGTLTVTYVYAGAPAP